MNKRLKLVFPHQLFEQSPLFNTDGTFLLIEEFLFFRQYAFHQQKIAFHRASMKFYEAFLKEKGHDVLYLSTLETGSDIRELASFLHERGINHVDYIDPTDQWLEQRLLAIPHITFQKHENLLFLNKPAENSKFFRPVKKSFFQTSFYIDQRKKYQILLELNNEPVGGKWSFDHDNRKKYPKGKNPPPSFLPNHSSYWEEATHYVGKHFSANPGSLSKQALYPIDFTSSREALQNFLDYRFFEFGNYEDAIVREENILHHSVLTPMLNVGLITPKEIIDHALDFAEKEEIPMNSTEGFVRQIIGWREFIRGMYECKGVHMRTHNFWQFKRKIPKSFYDGTTGILPIDETIKKVLKTGYCHHIERLMILGNFMLLCEFHPNEVYRWFMELFIDSYDWVMVPNVYGMSQFADGGTFATKPYIGGSNYIKKMSNYPSGPWEETWDALFWNFIDKHQDFFLRNPRLGMMVHTWNKMAIDKKVKHLEKAGEFLERISD